MSLFAEQQELFQKLATHITDLRQRGIKYAEAENDYKIALAQKVTELRAEGMAVGIINQIVYGQPDVARKRLERDIAQTMYEVAKEAINGTKLKIRITENQLDREYRG